MFKQHDSVLKDNSQIIQKIYDDIFSGLCEAGQIKHDIDAVLLTAGKDGKNPRHLIASKWHFLMRQFRFAISEYYNFKYQYDICCRKLSSWRFRFWTFISGKFYDLEKDQLEKAKRYFLLEIINQETRIKNFKELLEKLIELNGGKSFTNEQFQAEQTEFYEWMLSNKIAREVLSKKTGIHEGTIEACQNLSKESLLPHKVTPIIPLITQAGINKQICKHLPYEDAMALIPLSKEEMDKLLTTNNKGQPNVDNQEGNVPYKT